jgi:hypothetical protein
MAEQRRNIEERVDKFYTDIRNFPKLDGLEKGRYNVMNTASQKNDVYLELGIRPVTFKPTHRYDDFAEIISKYYDAGFEEAAKDRNPHIVSKVYNNVFRSRIKLRTATKELDIWVARFSWLFGNRIKVKYRNRNIAGNGFTIMS